VKLKGQFDRQAWLGTIDYVQYLANPVNKNDEGILDPKTHLIGYLLRKLEKRQPRRWVELSNQFTQKDHWHLGDPTFLLVPAGKTFPPEKPTLPEGRADHFLCYIVRDANPQRKLVMLEDQFDAKLKRKERITRIRPLFFGVPVQKNNEQIKDPKTHLAFYEITPRRTLRPPIVVATKDQLRRNLLKIQESIFLAVPSDKIAWGLEG
jgi:hypothetical protein